MAQTVPWRSARVASHKSSLMMPPAFTGTSPYPRKDKTSSIGMIVYTQSSEGEILYGLVKRKCGYGMKHILAGKFLDATCFIEISDMERMVLLYICSMSKDWERAFNILWTNSMNKNTTSTYFTQTKEKFINNRHLIKKMIEETTSVFPHGVWSFPKGHRERYESDIECALREVKEETMVDKVTLTSLPVQYETYKEWKYTYFVGAVDNTKAHNMLINDKYEIVQVAWCTLEEALKLIPTDAFEKRNILTHVHKLITDTR